ncbi:hypothetical protein E2C01_044212 [Portunus trituberculatus]|uniref:Uncharacterized protein n=1 Tax=Portunus trituberculatus TaxID=210409 RepID=A0A5B7G1N9_PORTR|nr:hypothetical protein [Portunus trituberculatus]
MTEQWRSPCNPRQASTTILKLHSECKGDEVKADEKFDHLHLNYTRKEPYESYKGNKPLGRNG